MSQRKQRISLLFGVISGMFLFLLLYLFCLFEKSGLAVMGVRNPAIEKTVILTFFSEIVFLQLKILFVYLFIGAVLGTFVWLFWRFSGVDVSSKLGIWKQCLLYLSSIFLLNLCFFILGLRKYPQLYTEFFYDHPGWRHQFQVFFTDRVPSVVYKMVSFLLFVLLLISLLGLFVGLIKKLPKKYLFAGILLITVVSLLPFLNFPSNNRGPNLIIFVVDSLRKDRVINGNYAKTVTPEINSLAEKGIVFGSAYVSLPRTFPEVISLLTGKYPHHHGVRHMFPSKEEREHRNGALPEILRQKGYATGVVTDFAGDVFSRMNIGFEKIVGPYFNFFTILKQRSLEMHYFLLPYITNSVGRKFFPVLKEFAHNADPFLLAEETKMVLRKFGKKEKFFVLVFFSTTHFPYAAPYPYYQMYTQPTYEGRYKYHKPPSIYEKENLSHEDIVQIRGLYDGAVRSVDEAIGEIIRFLKERKLFEKTIIVVTADHGENLYENGWGIGHGEHLRGDNVVSVPLIIYNPFRNYRKRFINSIVRDIDLTPTLLEMFGLPLPKDIEGVSLVPLLEGQKDTFNLTTFAETGIWFSDVSEGFYQEKRIQYPDITRLSKIDTAYNNEVVIKEEYRPLIILAKHRMLRTEEYKLIYMPTRKGVIFELYDLKKDPFELKNIATEEPEKVNTLKRQLYTWILEDRNIKLVNDYFLPLVY